jgi:hypothetical protein
MESNPEEDRQALGMESDHQVLAYTNKKKKHLINI